MYNWKVNTRVPMRIIHIKWNSFYWEEKFFLGQEKKEYIDNWRDFYVKIKFVSYQK